MEVLCLVQSGTYSVTSFSFILRVYNLPLPCYPSLFLLGRASPYLHNGVQYQDDGDIVSRTKRTTIAFRPIR